MVRLFDGEVAVASMQFSVETPDLVPGEDVGHRFAGQSNGLCGAGESGILHCITGLHTGSVPVTVDRLDAAPDDIDPGGQDTGWEEVVEVSLTTTTPSVLLCDGDHQQPVELSLGEGTFRVRYHASGMEAGRDADVRDPGDPVLDRYLLQFWPAPDAPDVVLRRTGPTAAYWHDTARSIPTPTVPAARTGAAVGKAADDAEVAEYRALIDDVLTSTPELRWAVARWLARHTLDLADHATRTWARPALDALERGQPLPALYDDRHALIAAVHRELATPEGRREWPATDDLEPRAPHARLSAVLTVANAASTDPSNAFVAALNGAQLADPRPAVELYAELRAHFLS